MPTKAVPFNAGGAAKLPNNKPVVYRIKTEGNRTNYVGVAQRVACRSEFGSTFTMRGFQELRSR